MGRLAERAHNEDVARSTIMLLLLMSLSSASASAQTTGLSEGESLARALEANPSLRAALLEVVAAHEATRSAELSRVPTFRASASGAYQESFSGTADGVALNDSQNVSVGVGVDWTSDVGTTLSVDLDSSASWRTVNRDPSTTQLYRIGPNYNAQLMASLRQPLLRGRRDDVLSAERSARASETQAAANRDVRVSEAVRDVLAAHWELWYAERALDVQVAAEERATRQRLDAEAQVELGTLARAEALRYASEELAIQESRRSAELAVEQQRVTLAELLVVPAAALSVHGAEPDAPEVAALDGLVAAALRHSPEIRAADAAIEAAQAQVHAAEDAARARLDLVASAGLVALWADDSLSGLQLPNDRPGFIASGGIELELPLRRSSADAELARSQSLLDAALLEREATERSVDATVTRSRAGAAAARTLLPSVSTRARLAEDLAEAERERVALGTATVSDLLDAQQSAREAELSRLRALVDVVLAARELEHAAGTLTERFSLRYADDGRSLASTNSVEGNAE